MKCLSEKVCGDGGKARDRLMYTQFDIDKGTIP